MAKGNRKGSKAKAGSTKKGQRDDDSERGSEPDVDSDSYYQDDVDKFHTDRDQILLDSGAKLPSDDFSSGEDEVLAFDDDEDEDDEQYQEMKKRLHQIRSHGHHEAMASDLEDEEKQKTPSGKSDKAWGSSRSKFYGGHDSDLEDLSGSEPEADALEEEEALAVQKRLLLAMDEDDVGLGMVKQASQLEEKTTEKITQDLSKLSKREKLKLLKKQSPELLDLIQDFKSRTEELQKRLLPVMNLIRNHKLPAESSGASLVETKTALYFNYLVNVSFYLMLKAKQSSVENHPVIKRLVQYRKLIKQMDELEPRCQSKMDSILRRLAKGEEFPTIQDDQGTANSTFKSVLLHKKKLKSAGKRKASSTKRLSEVMDSSESESDVKGHSELVEGGRTWGRKKSKLDVVDHPDDNGEDMEEGGDEAVEEEAGEAERRGINYQIEKNKGLTTRKRKELRNPRVKHKLKYRKAKIRRKGQVREVRKEMDRYGGEISGIRAGIKRSIRL